MAFKYDYPITDNPKRTIAAAALPEANPTRGSILDAVPTGTLPDFVGIQFQAIKLCFLTDDPAAGTVTFSLWARDVAEFGDANNRNPDPPPDLTKVLWTKVAKNITVDDLEEYRLLSVNKRAIYVQVTAFGGGTTTADLFIAPYEFAQPYTGI